MLKRNPHTWKPAQTCTLRGYKQTVVNDGDRQDVIIEKVPLDKEHLGELPPPNVFSLENQLKSGVDLKPVNSKVLSGNPNGQYTAAAEAVVNEALDALQREHAPIESIKPNSQ